VGTSSIRKGIGREGGDRGGRGLITFAYGFLCSALLSGSAGTLSSSRFGWGKVRLENMERLRLGWKRMIGICLLWVMSKDEEIL